MMSKKYLNRNKDYGQLTYDQVPLDTPLWCVYGHECCPTVLSCAVFKSNYNGSINIWGYSVYKNSPGYRTLGQDLKVWCEKQNPRPVFFTDQDKALDYLKDLTMPKKSVLKELQSRRMEREIKEHQAKEYSEYGYF